MLSEMPDVPKVNGTTDKEEGRQKDRFACIDSSFSIRRCFPHFGRGYEPYYGQRNTTEQQKLCGEEISEVMPPRPPVRRAHLPLVGLEHVAWPKRVERDVAR